MKAGQDPRKDQSTDGPKYPDHGEKTHTPPGGSPKEQGVPDGGVGDESDAKPVPASGPIGD